MAYGIWPLAVNFRSILLFRIMAVVRKKAGGHREANTIRRAPGARRVNGFPEIPVPDQTSGLLGCQRESRQPAQLNPS